MRSDERRWHRHRGRAGSAGGESRWLADRPRPQPAILTLPEPELGGGVEEQAAEGKRRKKIC